MLFKNLHCRKPSIWSTYGEYVDGLALLNRISVVITLGMGRNARPESKQIQFIIDQ